MDEEEDENEEEEDDDNDDDEDEDEDEKKDDDADDDGDNDDEPNHLRPMDVIIIFLQSQALTFSHFPLFGTLLYMKVTTTR